MKIARTKNTIKGSLWGFFNRVICILFPFFIRTIIIRVFGTEYLGLNSLFSSILHIFNITELGLSSAIVYNMYEPIAEDDYISLSALLNLYRKLYLIIGTVVLSLGLICIPFLSSLINGSYPNSINIYLLYILYLANTCIGYFFFNYKESILFAFQRIDWVNIVRLTTYIIMYLLQIITLTIFKNYYLYVFLFTLFTFLRGLCVSLIVDKKYPFIKCQGIVSAEKKSKIKDVVVGAAIGKICAATRGSCDGIVISSFLGLSILAIFDNYYYIMAALISILIIIETSLSGGVGNSIVKESVEKNYEDFQIINFIYMWIVSWCSICLVCLYQPFMKLWVGEELMFSDQTMYLFGIYFFASGMSSIPSVYANAAGLWGRMRIKSVAEVLFNLIMNVISVNFLGINGILFSTILSLIIIAFGWGSSILRKNYFKSCNQFELLLPQFLYLAITVIIAIIMLILCSTINVSNNYLCLGIRGGLCVIVPNILFLLAYSHTLIFKKCVVKVKSIFKI